VWHQDTFHHHHHHHHHHSATPAPSPCIISDGGRDLDESSFVPTGESHNLLRWTAPRFGVRLSTICGAPRHLKPHCMGVVQADADDPFHGMCGSGGERRRVTLGEMIMGSYSVGCESRWHCSF
jgi:hypothetical protein